MTEESKEFYRFIYAMKPTPNGWAVKMQFDAQFKGDIQEIKDLLKIVTKHTEKKGRNGMKWCDVLISLDGVFEDNSIAEECHKKLLSKIKNKPKCYE
jgi:hypothetical protein